MKKILIACLLLLISSDAFALSAAVQAVVGSSSGSTALANCSGPSSYTGNSGCVFREIFTGCATNCTGCTSGYTWIQDQGPTEILPCNVTAYAATFGTPISAGCNTTDDTIPELDTSFSTQETLYIAFKLYITNCTTEGHYPVLLALGYNATDYPTIEQSEGCSFSVYGGGSNYGTAFTLSTSTLYYVKMKAVKGTGSNATTQLWTSTNGTSWTDRGTVSDGTWTVGLNRMFFLVRAGGHYFTDIRVSATDINY